MFSWHRRLALLALFLFVSSCPSRQRLNVVLITFDTSRADAFGIYGSRTGATPAVDNLGREGVVFAQASATVPLTLPSHASLMTGTFPPYHGIRENGGHALSPRLTTLAQSLREHGYRTGAFVGAYVVDARWGLNHGFDMYSGSFDPTSSDAFSLGDLRRSADRVTDDALSWLNTRSDKPFFAWLHFYDPHSPYDPPPAYAQRFAGNPYIAAIAFADSQLGRLLHALDRNGQRQNTIIVVAADHGEGFGEHGESGHGLLLYEETLHVPLVLNAPGILPKSVRVDTPVSLVDVFPTIADLVGIAIPPQVQGHSLIPLLKDRGRHETPIYAETLYPRLRFGWSELRAWRSGGKKLIDSSDPELYDLATDPAERHDLSADAERVRDAQRRLRVAATELGKGAPSNAGHALDPEARARLASLGYITGAAPAPQSAALPSPRSKIAAVDALNRGRESIAAADFTGAERTLRQLAEDEPGMIEARVALGQLYLRTRKPDLAVAAFTEANKRGGDDPALRSALAAAMLESGRVDDALQFVRATIIATPDEPRYHYIAARALLAKGRVEEAKRELQSTLRINPRSSAALVELAGIAVMEKDARQAEELANRALAIDARAHGARLFLAQALELAGRPEEAWQQASIELQVSPDDLRPALYLAELAPKVGRDQEVEPYLRRAIRSEPRFVTPYLHLARHLLQSNSRFDEAIAITRKAIDLRPRGRDEALAYFLLADLYNRVGRDDLSRQNARRAENIRQRD
jgi:arylsulfatase A-like enzyme/predicted Zn-dependent protease